MYDVLYRRPEPLVPRGRSREVPERLTATGDVLVPLDEVALRAACCALLADGVESVALVFLFSYRDPAHEQRAAQIVASEIPGVSVSASHRITQEWREYERTSTTVVNAYVQPIMDRYLGAFGKGLAGRGFQGQVLVTQSNGGAFSLAAARSKPVHTIESGPAAGVTGSASLSRILGGTMPLDLAGAVRAIDRKIGEPLAMPRAAAAAGVVRLADVKMALAVRSITTERGLDPREYTLLAYGGGGPLHAVAIARELEIPRVVVPPSPSTFSAWGMLATDLRHDLVRTVLMPLDQTDAGWAEARYEAMRREIAT